MSLNNNKRGANVPEPDDMDVFVSGAGRCYEVGDELAGVVAHVKGIVGGLHGNP